MDERHSVREMQLRERPMPRFRLMGACGWIANSQIELGEEDFETEEEAHDAAWEAVTERIDSWVQVVVEEGDTP